MSDQQSDQYNRYSILRYETIFGHGFLSPGGLETTVEFCQGLGLQPGARVLDVGSGIGGAAFYMANTYGAVVTGIDLSQETIDIARERLDRSDGANIEFQPGSVLEFEFDEGSFDLIWSRDTFLHIAHKPELFRKLYSWLVPGGRLLLTDYARCTELLSAEFEAYIGHSGYNLIDLPTYANHLMDAGFTNVVAEDRTEQFLSILEREKTRLLAKPEAFFEHFDQSDLDYLIERWTMKIGFCKAEEMKWGLLQAER